MSTLTDRDTTYIEALIHNAGITTDDIPVPLLSVRQLAKIGGLSPSFFTQIGSETKGRIPRRDSLIRAGIALQLNFQQINKLMAFFAKSHGANYEPITSKDSELIIAIAASWETSEQLHPLRDLHIDLNLLSLEALKGDLCIVNTELWYLFNDKDNIREDLKTAYATNKCTEDDNEPISDILFQLTLRRMSVIRENLSLGFKVDYIISKNDLDNYIELHKGPSNKVLRTQLLRTIEAIEGSNFNFCVCDKPLYFRYEIKYDDKTSLPARLFFMSRDPYDRINNTSDNFLAGFATSSKDILNHFNRDIQCFHKKGYRSKSETIDILQKYLKEI